MNYKPNLDQGMIYLAYAWMLIIVLAAHFYKSLGANAEWWPGGLANASLIYCLLYTLWQPTPFSARWWRMGARSTP